MSTVGGELPADLSRDRKAWIYGLAYWLSNVDALPAAYELDGWQGTVEALGIVTNPSTSLPAPRRAELESRAKRDWEEAAPLVRDLYGAQTAQQEALAALRRLQLDFRARTTEHAARKLDTTTKTAQELLTEVIRRGLRRRLGLYLRDFDERIYLKLRSWGGDKPGDIAVCNGCGLVFEPKRRDASKCPACHAKPRAAALTYGQRADGGYAFHAPFGTIRVHRCETCGTYFNPTRSDARFCPASRCRQPRHRQDRT